jgi:hypothetical protein
MAYVAPYQRHDFKQCREHGPDWKPYAPDNDTGGLHFRNEKTGETVCCPCIWYNQTVEAHCESLRYSIEAGERRRAYWEGSKDSFKGYHLRGIAEQKAELEDLIRRSIEAGRPLKNGGQTKGGEA